MQPRLRPRDTLASSLTFQMSYTISPATMFLNRQHRGHHRVILIVVLVHAVAAHENAASDTSRRVRSGSPRRSPCSCRRRRIGLSSDAPRIRPHLILAARPTCGDVFLLASAINSASLDSQRPSPSKQKYTRPRHASFSLAPSRATRAEVLDAATFTAARARRSNCRGRGRLLDDQRDCEEIAVAQAIGSADATPARARSNARVRGSAPTRSRGAP